MLNHKYHLLFSGNKIIWLVCLGLVANTIICISALRSNNKQMLTLRNSVYVADKNNGDVSLALNELRLFVHGHMNTGLSSGTNAIKPPIQLKYTYERLVQAEEARAEQANAKVYTEAQNYCQAQNSTDFSGRNRVPCVSDYVTSHGVSVNTVPSALYQFDFISPIWSPDLAGWSLVLEVALAVSLIYMLIIDQVLKSRVRQL